MLMEMFVIMDLKMGAAVRMFFLQNASVAMRTFQDLCADQSGEIAKHPEDYALYSIGRFDMESLEFVELWKKSLISATDFIVRETEELEK